MAVTCTVRQIVTDALVELGIYAPIDTPNAADTDLVLNKLNRLLDNWNAERCAVYNVGFAVYTLVPHLQPHTIGPSGATYTVAQRPVAIDGANIVLDNVNPAVRSPLNLRDDQWWLGNLVRDITTTLPTDLYYSPGWPNGAIYLWPVPTVAYGLELETRVLLSNVILTDNVSLPPGYRDALTLSVAEECITTYGRGADPGMPALAQKAAQARARIFANNDILPRLWTKDSGMPSKPKPAFNYRSGLEIVH